jgi:hypothetical protein
MKPSHLGFAVLCAATGCGRALDLGSDVVWSTSFESGDLSDWSAAPGTGGAIESDAGGSAASVSASTDHARTGMYSAKFSSVAASPLASPYTPGGGCLYKVSAFPQSAYYSAWYFLPQTYETLTAWSVLKFMVPSSGDAMPDAAGGGTPSTALGQALHASELFDLSLLSLPGPQMTLVLFDARHPYLESPLPDPVPYLPIGKWFQIECFYRNDSGPRGELTVWLDGVPIYDVVRPTGGESRAVAFVVCSLVNALSPQQATLYVDDVVVSWTRVTPHGVLGTSP